MKEVEISIKLFASLRCYASNPEHASDFLSLKIGDGDSVKSVLARLGIPLEEASLIVVNDEKVTPAHRLKAGDQVSIFPMLAGG